jgi:hypothetical protein
MWAYVLALLPINPNQSTDHCKIKIQQIFKETKNNKSKSMVGILKITIHSSNPMSPPHPTQDGIF